MPGWRWALTRGRVCSTKDLDEVLQVNSVFTNVSKGATAKTAELEEAFQTTDVAKIILEILLKGEIQVSDKERDSQAEALTREIATIVAAKCVNPGTRLPYPVAVIEKAMKEMHFSPNLGRNAKQQALEVIRQLSKDPAFPLARAQMRLLVNVPLAEAGRVLGAVASLFTEVESESREGGELTTTVLVYPGAFREISEAVARLTRGKGTVHTLALKVLKESEDMAEFQ